MIEETETSPILIIEDDPSVQKFLQRALERAGYDVLLAPNGREASKIIQTNVPQLIITDLFMPEKDGIEVLIDIRKSGSDTQVIAISGGGAVNDVAVLHQARLLGAKHVFPKPLDLDALLDAIKSLLATQN